MTRRIFPSLAVFLFLFLLLPAGCGKEPVRFDGPLPGKAGQPGTEPLYAPLDYSASVTLNDAEARALTRQLSPASQGLASWKAMEAPLSFSLAYARKRPQGETAFSFCGSKATWGDLVRGLERLKGMLPLLDANPELLAASFQWVRLGPDFSFTGYYEPTLNASRAPVRGLSHPLYRRPPDLRNGAPYHTRNAIDRRGALRGRNLEIAYVDETDAFFLQVQGSGRLKFQDGSVIHVLYDGKNNRPYASLGRVMKEWGLLPEGGVNMRAIREYLARNPDQKAELLDQNQSYVFFRPATYGPIGSMGAVVTPWVSLAVDRKVIPHGAVTMVLAPLPGPDGSHTRPFPALTLPQDTGGAIRGHRVDLFCGAGPDAEHVAGHLDVKGALYILLPK